MPLRRHAGAVVRTESRKHLVTARDIATAETGRGRVLVRLGGREDLVHYAGDRVAPEADVKEPQRALLAALLGVEPPKPKTGPCDKSNQG